MTRLILTAAAVFISHGFIADGANADATPKPTPTTEAVTFSKVYVPGGFDANDHIQFVGEGLFTSSCYRPANGTVSKDQATKTIQVGPVAYKYAGFCLQVVLPFDRVIDVGVLSAGTWRVIQADGQAVGQIKVSPALVDDPDDHLYAPVSQAYVHQTQNRKAELMLNGAFPNACMSMDQVKFDVQDDVIVVQPIAKMSPSTAPCSGPAVPFTEVVQLGTLKAGRYLLHVRSMNAQAINTLIDL